MAALLLVGCPSGPPPCTPVSGGATPFATLDQWCQVSLANGDIHPESGVTPYTLNTPLFSDYAVKRRTVWMPSGGSATYDANNVFDFPDGTVFTKSFGFPDDMRKAQPIISWVETRIIWKNAGVWQAVAYVWDAAQKTATVNPDGAQVPISWFDANGQTVSFTYDIPGVPECEECHENIQTGVAVEPIGPKARNLNGNTTYPDGTTQNQLAYLTAKGLLSGAPDPSQAPQLPVWNDPNTGSLNDRARAYLESNCAHCHSLTGSAFPYGLYLDTFETDALRIGICKKPIAAGAGGCGLTYDIVPTDAAQSIMVCRLTSTEEPVVMPRRERHVVDVEGLQLITDWISALPSASCSP